MSYLDLNIINNVTEVLNNTFVCGSLVSKGFSFNKRIPKREIISDEYTELANIETLLTDGVSSNEFLCRSEDLVLDSIRLKNQETLTPKFGAGKYWYHSEERYLYSDYSVSHLIDGSQLVHKDVKTDSISIAVYQRNKLGGIYRSVLFSEGEDSLLPKYSLEDLLLTVNDYNYCGLENTMSVVLDAAAGKRILLNYLGVKVLSLTRDGNTLNASKLNLLKNTEEGYSIDNELGIIYLGGQTYDSTYLTRSINVHDTVIYVSPCDEFIAWPEEGLIKIDEEEIVYKEKGFDYVIVEKIVFPHISNSMVAFIGGGSFTSGEYTLTYKVLPRVDYEITQHTLRTSNKMNGWLDVSPVKQTKPNKIVEIVSETISLKKLTISVDRREIANNLFGPIYYGTDTGRVTVKAIDYYDQPIEDLDITLEVLSGPSLIDDTTILTRTSNTNGEVYASLYTPYDEDSMFSKVNEASYASGTTILTTDHVPVWANLKECILFQILKHDPFSGSLGSKRTVTEILSSSDPWGEAVIKVRTSAINNIEIIIVVKDSVKYQYSVKHVIATGAESLIYINDIDLALVGETNLTAYLIAKDDIIWDGDLLNGTRVLMYTWSADVVHPITKSLGAYFPVLPDKREDNVFTYYKTLPEPDAYDDSNNLGGYVMYVPQETILQANAVDPLTGNIIYSNKIRIYNTLPAYLSGIDNTSSLPIPYGFTLMTDEFNIGSGLGGTNFLTVNPNSSAMLSLRGSI